MVVIATTDMNNPAPLVQTVPLSSRPTTVRLWGHQKNPETTNCQPQSSLPVDRLGPGLESPALCSYSQRHWPSELVRLHLLEPRANNPWSHCPECCSITRQPPNQTATVTSPRLADTAGCGGLRTTQKQIRVTSPETAPLSGCYS